MAKNAGKATSAVLLRGECNGPATIVLIKSMPWSFWLILFPLFGPLSPKLLTKAMKHLNYKLIVHLGQ